MRNEALFQFPPEGEMTSGKRYMGPTGVEVTVTKGGKGLVTDGEVQFIRSDKKPVSFEGVSDVPPTRELKLGKRFGAQDPKTGTLLEKGVEILVIKPGEADIRCDGFNMVELTPKALPSAD